MKIYKPKNRDEIIIHPKAAPAAAFLQSFPPLFNEPVLQPLAGDLVNSEVLSAVKLSAGQKSGNVLGLMTPMPIIVRFQHQIRHNLTSVCLYAENEMSDTEIERIAWLSALSYIMLSPDQTRILSQLREVLNEKVPEYILRDIMGKNRVSLPRFAELTGHNVNTIKAQKKAANKIAGMDAQFDGFPSDFAAFSGENQ